MKNQINLIGMLVMLFFSCNTQVKSNETGSATIAIQGTWRLLAGILIEKGDTAVTDYTKGREFIKILNDTHFAFLGHDLGKGKNADSSFSCGGGNYSLKDSLYTEHLAYCNDRQWEGNDFHFTVAMHNDTLIQQGVERIDSIGINRINIEKYVRVREP